jgi:transcriptional regulator GlxA family with amidase domain
MRQLEWPLVVMLADPTARFCERSRPTKGRAASVHPAAHLVVPLLPKVIHIDSGWSARTGMAGWMRSTLQLLAAEAQELRPGGETIITRLADVLVVQAIRTWMERDPSARTGWLAALHDPRIGRALMLVHREPARTWSVESLASAVGMSRSGFAARFTELVGEPAMQYVTRWRMLVALTWLSESDASLSQMAGRLGYQSEAAFSRAFERILGTSPGAARRRDTRAPSWRPSTST